MSPEAKPNNPDNGNFDHLMHDLEAAANKIDGYYVGKLGKVDEEIEDVESWENSVELGAVVKRKGQELASLKKLRLEIQRSREHVVPMLANIINTYSDQEPPTLD